MWEITGGDKNKPVPVKDMCKFKSMQRFPYGAVIDALKGEHSRFLEVSGEPGQEVVKRKHAYVLGSMRAQQDANSIYAKGFGDEEPTTQFDLEAFFTQFFPINAVRLRRTNPQKMFKGSVFVEFQERESAEKFVALDPPPKWKDHDLLIMLKTTYMAGKSDAIRKGEIEPNRTRPNKFYEGRDLSGGGNRADKDDWKKRRENDQRNDNRRGGGGDRRGRGRGRGRGGRGRGGSDRDRDRNRNGGDERREHNPNGYAYSNPPKAVACSPAAPILTSFTVSSLASTPLPKRTPPRRLLTCQRRTRRASLPTASDLGRRTPQLVSQQQRSRTPGAKWLHEPRVSRAAWALAGLVYLR